MKITFQITYDAGKLAKEIKGIIKDFLKNTGEAFVVGSKKAIKSGNFKKLEQSTLDVRKAGTSRGGKGAYGKSISSAKPLVHTGRLLKGLKLLKNGDMSVHEYGTFHLGDLQTAEQIEEKSGTAYTTASGSMIPNKTVPIRDWFKMDEATAKKSIVKFKKSLKDNFKRKMSQRFTRFKA